MRSAIQIAREGWRQLTVKCPDLFYKRFRMACILCDAKPQQVLLSLVAAVANGDIKLNPSNISRMYGGNISVCISTGEFEPYRVELLDKNNEVINTTTYKNEEF